MSTRSRDVSGALPVLLVALVFLASACSKKESALATGGADSAVTGETAPPGAMLAYTHALSYDVAPETIAARVDDVRIACGEQRFGAMSPHDLWD